MNASLPFTPADLPYRPPKTKKYRPGIGLVGCGSISKHHLQAYRNADFDVRALCDLDIKKARASQQAYFPEAEIFTDLDHLLDNDSIEVVDIATHPAVRPPLIEAALRAGKHVLSQKPFVLDLEVGARLAELAQQQGVLLAVNQNGRWAPHLSYIREAVEAGLLGELEAVHFGVHWDHSWVKGTPFEKIKHLILYDFAIHWFDLTTVIMGKRQPTRVYASMTRSLSQEVAPDLLAQVLVEYENAQATLVFDGHTRAGALDSSIVVGSKATIRSTGIDLNKQQVTLCHESGEWNPKLEGQWFDDGFQGAMGELLCAIEQKREPRHSARENLRSLELCFAAIASAEQNQPVVPGSVSTFGSRGNK